MKRINLIKMFFPLIHPYISWFYRNQSNFFSIEHSFEKKTKKTKGQNQDEAIASSCLMLAMALLWCMLSNTLAQLTS